MKYLGQNRGKSILVSVAKLLSLSKYCDNNRKHSQIRTFTYEGSVWSDQKSVFVDIWPFEQNSMAVFGGRHFANFGT